MTAIDQEAIGRVPVGYRRTVLCAALLKRALTPVLPAGERLDMLEKLNGLTDGLFTAAMLAAVRPMSDVECAMVAEAMSLDGGARADGRCPAADAVLTRADVFAHFAAANPSLLVALKLAIPASSKENCSDPGTVFGSGTVQADDQMARAKAEAVARKKLAAYGPAVEKFHTRKPQ